MTSTRSRLLLIDQKSSGTVRGHIGADSVSSRVGSGQVWGEWGTGRGRIGVDSVSSRVGSGQGLDGVGDGWRSHWGGLRVKSGRVEMGSGPKVVDDENVDTDNEAKYLMLQELVSKLIFDSSHNFRCTAPCKNVFWPNPSKWK